MDPVEPHQVSGMFVFIINTKDAKRIIARFFFKASFFFFFYFSAWADPLAQLKASSGISIGQREDNGFYSPGVGRGFPSGRIGRHIDKVTDTERTRHHKSVLTTRNKGMLTVCLQQGSHNKV